MIQQPNGDSQDFAEAYLEWDVERLVKDLEKFEKRSLTKAEKRNLQAILLGLSASQAQDKMKVAKKTRSLDGYFNKIRRTIELFLDLESSTLKTSHDVVNVLASYRKRQELPPPSEFYLLGRDADRQKLTELRNQYKIVLIKSGAGVGKSTLAREFLQTQFKKVIRIEMGLESGNVTPAEEKVSQILRKDFDEEPSRDFGINLDILREKLADRANPIGVLIDNLEPALDENYRFREKLRGYDALLAVLGDREVCSFTLITSRRSLITPRARVNEYSLEGLDITAWRQYFHDCENGADSEALLQMCVAYNGNAKVMDILHGAIKSHRFNGNIGAYWSRYKDALLADSELETLISVEMDWLRDNQPDAYKLLCRMGCYRYQDVKTVPFEGLICLLWDVPESRQNWVVDYLSKSSLIEVKGEYYLHPAVREAAKSRLLDNKIVWERSNREAATYWTLNVKIIKDIDSNNQAFEAFHHYILIDSFEEAAKVLIGTRESGSEWEKLLDDGEHLAEANRRLAQHSKIISAIKLVLPKLSKEMKDENLDMLYCTSILYKCWADNLWLRGKMHDALQNTRTSKFYTEQTLSIIEKLDDQNSKKKKLYLQRLFMMNLIDEVGCNYDLWEIQEAVKISRMVIQQCTERHELGYENYKIEASSYLSMCLSLEDSEDNQMECETLIEASLNCDSAKINHWCSVHRLLFSGNSYKNLKHLSRAKELYLQTIGWTEKHKCHLNVKGEAQSGLAEILRLQGNICKAMQQHQESISILEKIGAKCGLAEAYFQIGLTYQATGEHDLAEEYKTKSIELFEQMEAPKQIARVNEAFEQGAKKGD